MAATRTIVGRDAELERLRQVVQGENAPFAAFIEGEAGIGKTALLETIKGEASAAGTLVLQARPTAAEAASSFAALDDLLRPAIDGLAQLPAPQRRALPPRCCSRTPTVPSTRAWSRSRASRCSTAYRASAARR